jgi:DNA-binding response OmpR family regulator
MAKILVIDDETPIAVMIKKMLEKAGHEVEIAINGNEGLILFDKFHPELLITDIVMPEKEGLELIFELRRKNPDLFQYQGYLTSAKHLGANMVFQKPLDHKEFMKSISELLKVQD